MGARALGAPIGVAFTDYAAAMPTLATTSRTLKRYAPGVEVRTLHISVSEAQRVLGVSPSMMKAIALQRQMFVLTPDRPGATSLLKADAVQKPHEELADFLLPDDARLFLGMGRKVMLQIEAAGLIRRVPQDERIMESRPFRKSELEAFVSACGGKGKKMSSAQAKVAGLTPITRAAAQSRLVPDVCQALLDGRLSSVATVTNAHGLMRLRFRMEDLDRVLPPGRETMSMEDAAPSIGCKYSHIGLWVRKGFLETVEVQRRGESGQRIEHSEWDRFCRDYITGGQLAELAGQSHSTWLSRHLRFLGVEPVSGPGIDESRLCLFRRADCTQEVMKEIRRVTKRPKGSPQEKRQRAFEQGELVAAVTANKWGAMFERTFNRYFDPKTGRTLQVIAGRRPDLTGVFKFSLQQASLTTLRTTADVWVALVPFEMDNFILAPLDLVLWRGLTHASAYVTLRYDGRGQPLDMQKWAVTLPSGGSEP